MHLALASPSNLGLTKTLEFSSAPVGKTFYYEKRKKEVSGGHLPVIESQWEDANRFRKIKGPFIYAVTEMGGAIRYIGKSEEKYLYQRWLRPQPHIHHRESRDYIIRDLSQGKGPLLLWSATATELKNLVPWHRLMHDNEFVTALEACWLDRWGTHLWNDRSEPLHPSFNDGEYWK